MAKSTFFLFCLAVLTVSQIPNQLREISDYWYPRPSPKEIDFPVDTIAILQTNDMHGSLEPTKTYGNQLGGATLLSTYVKGLKEEWGDKLLWLDGGDQFQGTIDSNVFAGEPMTDLLNELGLQSSAVGNHEFDFGIHNLTERIKEAKWSYTAANLYDKLSGNITTEPPVIPYDIFEVGGYKIGIIGLITVTTPQTTATNVSQYNFLDYKDVVENISKVLREKGVNAVGIVAHVGVMCNLDSTKTGELETLRVWSEETIQNTTCNEDDELPTLLKSLPKGTVDFVAGGHTHEIVHHWFNGVPVAIGGSMNNYFNIFYLTFSAKEKKLLKVLIEGPVPICDRVYTDNNKCPNEVYPRIDMDLTRFSFHGTPIAEDNNASQLIWKYEKEVDHFREDIVAYVKEPCIHSFDFESQLGNLFADAFLNATGADFAVLNMGAIRIDWSAGNLTMYRIYRTIPFENRVSTIEMTGAELKKIFSVLQAGKYGFYPTGGGLRMEVQKNPRKLLSISLQNGTEISDDRTYTVVGPDFFFGGGDDFAEVLKFYKPRKQKQFNRMRDALANHVREMKVVNSELKPLVNISNPRLIVRDAQAEEKFGRKFLMLKA